MPWEDGGVGGEGEWEPKAGLKQSNSTPMPSLGNWHNPQGMPRLLLEAVWHPMAMQSY